MKALSIKQPWAWLIVAGYKDIENRNWPTKFRGRIYVHVGKRFDNLGLAWLIDKGMAPIDALLLHSNRIPRGAIIGEVDIVDCVEHSKSPWFVGPYGFVLANPTLYDQAIPSKGRLGFFDPKIYFIPMMPK